MLCNLKWEKGSAANNWDFLFLAALLWPNWLNNWTWLMGEHSLWLKHWSQGSQQPTAWPTTMWTPNRLTTRNYLTETEFETKTCGCKGRNWFTESLLTVGKDKQITKCSMRKYTYVQWRSQNFSLKGTRLKDSIKKNTLIDYSNKINKQL